MKFRNNRRRRDSLVPAIKEKKITKNKKPLDISLTPQRENSTLQTNSEDIVSIATHQNTMTTELTKKNPNLDRVSVLLRLTFTNRQDAIVNNFATVEKIKLNYPGLFSFTEVIFFSILLIIFCD